jgi:hypothetical protein
MRVSIMKWLSISAFALASIVGQASAQSNPGIGSVFQTAPFLAGPGEQVLLCAANITGLTVSTTPSSPTAADPPGGGVSLSVTLSLLNGVTGAVLLSEQVMLPPLGSTAYPPSPCLQVAPAPTVFAPVSNSFIGVVMLNPQPLPPGLCAAPILGQYPPNPCGKVLTTSLQIYTPDPNGNPTNVRSISFEPPNPCFQAAGAAACKVVLPGALTPQ